MDHLILARPDQTYRVHYDDGHVSALMSHTEASSYAKIFGGRIKRERLAPRWWQFWKAWPEINVNG